AEGSPGWPGARHVLIVLRGDQSVEARSGSEACANAQEAEAPAPNGAGAPVQLGDLDDSGHALRLVDGADVAVGALLRELLREGDLAGGLGLEALADDVVRHRAAPRPLDRGPLLDPEGLRGELQT